MSDPVEPPTDDIPDPSSGSGCGALFLLSILAPLFADILAAHIFGRESSRDSASQWGVAPVAHLLLFAACLPVLWLAYAVSLALWRRVVQQPCASVCLSLVTATVVYLPCACVFWWLSGGGKVG